MSDFESKLT